MPAGDERPGRGPALLERTSIAEQVAGVLREWIMEGRYKPRQQLSEEKLTQLLDISRNSLREAFRLLGHERLLVHRLNKGVFVNEPGPDDLSDLYRVRRMIECAAVRGATQVPDDTLKLLAVAVDDARLAANEGRWEDVGTANLRFHEGLVGLAASPRIDELMRRVWAELRLVWHVMDNPKVIFEPYYPRNAEILGRLTHGDIEGATTLLDDYLSDAEEQLVAAYAATTG